MENKLVLFIDTVSIQQYIFSSNKLKENIGASYIVENSLFNFGSEIERGYIGGGNALLFFESKEERRNFMQEYSRKVLSHFPGIRLAFSEEDNFIAEEPGFRNSMQKLVKQLIKNKSLQHLEIMPFKYGVVDDCPLSNEGQEVEVNSSYISKMSKLKMDAAKESIDATNKNYAENINEYCFTNEQDKLGQPDEKGYIAIVHADGNGIGKQFMSSKSLADIKTLSDKVSGIAKGVLGYLVKHIVEDIMPELIKENNGFNIQKEDGKYILPFRQILAGGDDITFVCEGKLGVHLAKKLLELMSNPPLKDGEPKWMKVDACAGVAIVHTKFPFYKAYQLAEELCAKAKAESRDKKKNSDANRLAFLISSTGLSGDLESIIEQNYSTPSGNMFYGSYSLGNEKPLDKLLNGASYLSDPKKISKNKVLALRDVLKDDETAQKYFLAELKASGISLPDGLTELWTDGETRFYDMIELMEFYPEFLLKKQTGNNGTV